MRLILSLTGGGLSGPATMRTLSEGSVTIGRGASNGWVLPDPQQLMSRTHCAVSIEGSRAVLTDLSSNGVFVNGARQPTERDMRIVLTDGDSFAFADYVFRVVILEDGAHPTQGSGASPIEAFPGTSSFNIGGRDPRSPIDVDPLADQLGRPLEAPDPFALSPNSEFSHPISHVAVNPRGTPDPFDAQPQRSGGFGDQDMFRGVTPASDWNGLPQADHARATSAAMPVQRVVNPMSMDDFDKLLGGLDVSPAPQTFPGALPPTPAAHAPPTIPAAGMLNISLDDLLGDAPVLAPSETPSQVGRPSTTGGHFAGSAEPPLAHTLNIDPPPGVASAHVVSQAPTDQFSQAPHSTAPAQDATDPFAATSTSATMLPSERGGGSVDPGTFRGQMEAPKPGLGARDRVPVVSPPTGLDSHNPFEDPEPRPGVSREAALPAPSRIEAARPQPSTAGPPSATAGATPVTPSASSEPRQDHVPSSVNDALAAFSLFLEGAGVAPSQVDSSNPAAALKAAGAVFRAMAEGLREVLISRTEIKSEMRVERTMISSHGNNALKFSVTPDDAVIALLTAKRPGYMPPLAATKEAFGDIKQHELAVMAGVQTALMDLLKRFEPEVLEKRLSPSALGAILPAARKARYWDGFQDAYKQISQEAEDDFQSIFGRSFAKAYTAQTRKD